MMKARSPSLIDRRVLDPLLVRAGVLPRGTPLPETPPGEKPVRFAESPPEAPESVAEVPETVAEVPDDTPAVANVDTVPEEPVKAPGFGSGHPTIRTQAPDPVPQALDISTLMSDWKPPDIVLEAPDTGSEYPDVVMEAPDAGPEYPDVVTEAPEPIPGDEPPGDEPPGDEPLERRLADLLSWAIDATGATAAFVADENGLPLANRESPEALIAAAPLVSRSLEGMGTLVPSYAQGSAAAIELESHNALHLIWVDSGRGRLAIGLVLADALASAMIRTVRTALERAVSM
ncbi:MAG: hypothetical protein GY856_18585 [bacterium]|nr:hypothetical protein [bacterium]